MKKACLLLIGLGVVFLLLALLPAWGIGAVGSLRPNEAGLSGASAETKGGLEENSSSPLATVWIVETVDGPDNVGMHTSLALDSSNRPHITYYVTTTDALKYAYHDGSAWQLQIADNSGNVGWFTSLVLDTSDLPRASYYDHVLGDLKYARYDGTTWISETVDSTNYAGFYDSLAWDSLGRPHISYVRDTESPYPDPIPPGVLGASPDVPRELVYTWFDGATWPPVLIVGDVGSEGGHTSLVLDGANLPHISYFDANPAHSVGLWYAHFTGSPGNCGPGNSYQCDVVDNVGTVGKYTSLALDSAGLPHISYYDVGNQDLKYAYYDGSTWYPTTLDSSGDVGRYTSLALDSNDRPHISYLNFTNGNLKYAYYDGSSWQFETVDTVGAVGGYTSLALDVNDQPHISYYDYTNRDLKYAWKCIQVDDVSISGPAFLPVGADGAYTASYTPLTATLPVTLTWDNGTVGPTAVYSWTYPGFYTVTVTATNRCAQVQSSFVVEVCQPVEGVTASGPTFLLTGQVGTYTATYTPLTTTLPVTLTWDNGTVGPTANYSWSFPGTYTVIVTATNPCGQVRDTLVVEVCQPVEGAGIAGPTFLLTGQVGTYTATYTPLTTTLPVTLTWDNGTVGPTANYSWSSPGIYTIIVTATSRCGQVQDSLEVEVCQPVEGVAANGPAFLLTGQVGTYTASYTPLTSTLPVALAWDNGTAGPTANYSWNFPGTYMVYVTATNPCGQAQDSFTVEVCQPVEGVTASGPTYLLTGQVGTYTATYRPLTTTLPVTLTWDNGTVGPSANYSWSFPGSYTVTITATSYCGQVRDTLVVEVCQPVEEVTVNGPAILETGEVGTYTATYAPLTSTLPMAFLWDNGTTGPMAAYSWAMTGTYTVFVTATNACGEVQDSFTVQVVKPVPSVLYLPLVYTDRGIRPDLIITTVTLNPSVPNDLRVVITNIGSAPARSFWIDGYLDPIAPPEVNQTWSQLGCEHGLAWFVTLLNVGDVITLTVGGPYYQPDHSNWPETSYPTGTHEFWSFVDSWGPPSPWGGVKELDEGNNRYGPILFDVVGQSIPWEWLAIPPRPRYP